MAILSVENVTMRFGGLTAVNGLSFEVEEGQIFSIIGPNGAGKTTAFNVVTGIYAPTSGKIRFQGKERKRPFALKNLIAFLLVGLLTSLIGLVAIVNIDQLWQASMRGQETFSYAVAYDRAGEFVGGGGLRVNPNARKTEWTLFPPDGENPISVFSTEAAARMAREQLHSGRYRTKTDGDDIVAVTEAGDVEFPAHLIGGLAYGKRELDGDFELFRGDKTDFEEWKKTLDEVMAKRVARKNDLFIAMLVGFLIGPIAAYAVWNRSRRTTDYIALGGVARTFQNIRLFQNMTVLENVLVGLDRSLPGGVFEMSIHSGALKYLEKEAEEKGTELLHFVGLKGNHGGLAKNLPYGDQRRLEIARALACGPKLLLLDEPAAGMNPSETVDLMGLIKKIRDRGVTVLLIEHHMSLVMGISDRIAVLDYGVKIAEGAPHQVKNDPRVIEAYLGKEEVS